MNENELNELLYLSASKLGVELNKEQAEMFMKYKFLIQQWNEKMNLTAITDDTGIIIKHFADSMSILPIMLEREEDIRDWEGSDERGLSVIDVGTGAGFPGIPLKIVCPGLNLTLLDSLNKRLVFIEDVVKELGLKNVNIIHSRAEDGGRDTKLRDKFDFCVSRAVARLNVLCELCMPFVKEGGYFISLKGPDVYSELNEAEITVETLGGQIEDVVELDIPESEKTGEKIRHCAVIIRKVEPTPKAYPRKAGMAAKKPIK